MSDQKTQNERERKLPRCDKRFDQNDCRSRCLREEFHQTRIGAGIEQTVGCAGQESEEISRSDIMRKKQADEESEISDSAEQHEGTPAVFV